MATVIIHGADGEAEFGTQVLSLKEAFDYLNLLKSVKSFYLLGAELVFVDSTLYTDTQIRNGLTLNIFTREI